MSEFKFFDVGTGDPIGKYAQPKPYGSVKGGSTASVDTFKATSNGGPSSADRKKYGRNLSRAMNQRGK